MRCMCVCLRSEPGQLFSCFPVRRAPMIIQSDILCLSSCVHFSVFDYLKINITNPSYYIQCRELCHIIHLIVNNMYEPKRNQFLPQKYLAMLDFNHHSSHILVKINHSTRGFNTNIADPSN